MKRNMLKVVAASLAGAMLLTACGGSGGANQTSAAAGGSAETSAAAAEGSTGGEKVITMAQTGDWDTFMPMNTTNAGADNVIELMFDRLMVINTDGTFGPRLAESWETNEAQDKITYHLNENAKWQDGEPVTAEDVVYSSTGCFLFLSSIICAESVCSILQEPMRPDVRPAPTASRSKLWTIIP